jgi:DNA-binding transcriptional LysR family regulator
MRLDRTDLNLFVVFDVIYTERNLTRAGTVLHLTQPAVSSALNRLRAVFGDELFVRNPRGMQPTPVADNIIGPIREALTLLNFSLNEGAAFDPERSEKVFRLSMNDLSEYMLLPGFMAALQKNAPKLSVRSYYVGREDIVQELSGGQIDVAIDVPLINDPNLCHQPLSKGHYVCAVRPDHPAVTQALTLETYLALQHVHVSSRRSGGNFIDSQLNKLGGRRDVALRVQHFIIAAKIVGDTDFAWTVPKTLADQLGLYYVELPFELPPLEWHLYWHKNADNDQANRWLREVLLSVVSLGAVS